MNQKKKLMLKKKIILNLNYVTGGFVGRSASGGGHDPSSKPGSVCNEKSKVQSECFTCRMITIKNC